MSNPQAILIVSQSGTEIYQELQASSKMQSMIIDLLPDPTSLFAQLSQKLYQLLIIDVDALSQADSLNQFLWELETQAAHTALIVLAMPAQRSQAIKLLQSGATDYLLYPIDTTELIIKIERSLEIQTLRQNSPLFIRSEAGIDELLLLNKAIQEIIQTLELGEALKIVLTQARQVTQADLLKIYLTNQKGDLSRDNALTKISPLADHSREDNFLFSLAQRAAITEKFVYMSEPQWSEQSILSTLLVPMVSRKKLIGVLALGSQQPEAFSANHIGWLSVFCHQAATAIENAQLFHDLSSAYIDLAQSREKILQSRNTLEVVFDGIADGLYILNQDLTISAINHIEAKRQGYSPNELVGQSYLCLDWTQSAPGLLNQIRESLHTGKETVWISGENEQDSYLKDREFRIYPIRNRLAQIEQVVIFAQDVSERRRWQASLFRSANLVAVGQLAGSVAHQINNPLTVTMTNSQLILLDSDPQAEVHELATGILRAGERIQNIVGNLLEFSNQERYFFIQTDLVDTLEGALALVIRSLTKAQIKVVTDYQVRPVLSASVSHLKLVWVNLLLNARDALANSAKHPEIIISTQTLSKREVQVIIADNGVGLMEKELEQLFRPFFTTKPGSKALGLGLYSAHEIVERHNGRITVTSKPGVLTQFSVTLPLDNPRDL